MIVPPEEAPEVVECKDVDQGVAYFIDASIQEIPSVAYIARELGGTIYTNARATEACIRRDHPRLRVKRLPTIGEIRADMRAASVKVILYPDYHIRYFRDLPGVKHVQVFHGTSDKIYDYRRSVLEYDLFLIAGADAYERYRRRGLLKRGTGVLVGYPKLDRVFRGEMKRADELARLGLDPGRKTVLYAPTWVDKAFNSSWKRFRNPLTDKPSREINLLIKLHPNIKRYRANEVEDLGKSIRAAEGTILFDEAADIVPFMAASDLLVGDVSAVMREYLAFGNPMVFLSCKPRWMWSRDKKRLWDCGEVVTDPSKVWEVILAVLANPGKYAPRIRRHLERTFFDTSGDAALRVKREVLKLLDLNPPSPLGTCNGRRTCSRPSGGTEKTQWVS